MDFTGEEVNNFDNILSHAIFGLNKEELLTGFSYGGQDHVRKKFAEAKTGGIIYQPTKMGVELFMWAYGHGQLASNDFFKPNIEFPNELNIEIGEGISTKRSLEQAKGSKENNS